jgi:hypothetical protein
LKEVKEGGCYEKLSCNNNYDNSKEVGLLAEGGPISTEAGRRTSPWRVDKSGRWQEIPEENRSVGKPRRR